MRSPAWAGPRSGARRDGSSAAAPQSLRMPGRLPAPPAGTGTPSSGRPASARSQVPATASEADRVHDAQDPIESLQEWSLPSSRRCPAGFRPGSSADDEHGRNASANVLGDIRSLSPWSTSRRRSPPRSRGLFRPRSASRARSAPWSAFRSGSRPRAPVQPALQRSEREPAGRVVHAVPARSSHLVPCPIAGGTNESHPGMRLRRLFERRRGVERSRPRFRGELVERRGRVLGDICTTTRFADDVEQDVDVPMRARFSDSCGGSGSARRAPPARPSP